MQRFGVSDETIARGVATPEFRALLRMKWSTRVRCFEKGLPLIGMVNRELALDLDLFSRGGLEILRAIERRDYDVLRRAAGDRKATKLQLALRAVSGKMLPFLRLGLRASKNASWRWPGVLSFDQFYILTGGAPNGSTITAVFRIYDTAFVQGNLGYASALSMVLLVLVLIITGLGLASLPKKGEA